MKDYKKILEGVIDIISATEKSDIGFANICTYVGENCPELKESEDEKIKEALIQLVKCNERSGYFVLNNVSTGSMIAWLEKQGEQKPIDEDKTEIYDQFTPFEERLCALTHACQILSDEGKIKFIKKHSQEILDIAKKQIEIEQKHAWNVEDEKIRDEICIYIGAKQDISLDVHNRWLSWLEKQGSEPNWCHHKIDLSNCSEEYRKAYYDGWNNCNLQHSQCKSESNDVIKCLINGLKFYYEDVEEATWGTEKFSMKVKDILSWLEKQREKPCKPVYYIRLGNIPSDEKSKIYRNEEEIGIEEGVSVYPAFESNGDIVIGLSLPITQTTLYTQQHLLEYESRPCYLVTGDCVGKGSDGEPLIKNVRIIKEIKPYRIKQDKENNTYVIKNTPNCGISCSKEEIPKWLEKQDSNFIENGYTNNKDIIKYADNYSHAIWHKLMDNFKNIKDYYIGCNDVSDIVLNAIIDAYNWLEKQGEQKPVDKVKPKFEVDNWIVYNRDDHSREILQIYDIRDGRYYFTDNVHLSWSIKECDEKSHLWTIQDAKDGDVLVDEDNNIGIFEGIEGMCWHSYIYLGCNNCLYGFDTGGSHMQNNTKPATKERRDTLEKAMADAGYTFDFEKKELKKIHVIDEGKAEMDYCFTKMMNGEKVTPTWSEEDERSKNAAISACKYMVDNFENSTKQYEDAIAWLEKQDKQNLADKPETAFHEGDWIVQENIGVYKVIEVCESWYEVIDIEDNHYSISFDKEYMCHLWSIKDAKDGDVLIDKSGSRECPFIFKETKPSDIKTDILNPLAVLGYCGIGGAGFTKGSGWGDTANCIYYPATKEQRDTLMKAMTDAGYTFDFEKKELKLLITNGGDFESENCVQNNEWSKEDSKIIEEIINDIECARAINYHAPKEGYEFRKNWLKSLKDRVQPKQGWSEEDEKRMKKVMHIMHILSLDGRISNAELLSMYDWLKSLRPQNSWKPTDEQMDELENEYLKSIPKY